MISALTSLSSFRTVFLTATTSRNETESRGHLRVLLLLKFRQRNCSRLRDSTLRLAPGPTDLIHVISYLGDVESTTASVAMKASSQLLLFFDLWWLDSSQPFIFPREISSTLALSFSLLGVKAMLASRISM